MKKRVLSALLVLCMACSMVSTVWANQATPETADEPQPASAEVTIATPESAAESASQDSSAAADSQTFESTDPDSGIIVQVDAPAGALPDGAQMSVALLGNSAEADTDETLATVAAELDNADVAYEGFVALDISFTDADGEKVEPIQPVSVSFSLPADILPEDVDADTLAVQHLAEDEAGEVVSVDTVADAAEATEGTISIEAAPVAIADADTDTETVTAEFEVDGFSSFVVTWREDKWPGDDTTDMISFTIVDTDDNPLTLPEGTNLTYHLPDLGIVTFDEMVEANGIDTITIEGVEYTFRNATLVIDGTERHPISSAERIAATTAWGNDQVRFYDSVFPGDSGYYTRDDGASGLELIYERKEDSEIDVYEPDPVYTKTAVTTDGGETYDLSLTVSGDVGESSQRVKLDVLFIVDQSGSMDDTAYVDGERKTYQQIVSDAAGELASGLAANPNIDARFAVVTFSDSIAATAYYDDAILRQSWASDAQSVITATNVTSNGGTNYEAGMMAGRAAMLEARPDAMKYVIFLSDGQPTFHYTENGDTDGGGNYTAAGDDTNAYAQAVYYDDVNGFFTVGVGTGGASADTYLATLRGRVETAVESTVGSDVDSDNFSGYTAEDPSELSQRFQEIQAQITNLSMKNVKITDTLSRWVEPVEGEEPYVVIKDENGNVVQTEDGHYSITGYDSENEEVSFTLDFDDGYELRQGYTYEVHLKVQPTDDAYNTFASTGYNATGEANTGTYAGLDGFYSNVEKTARLEYDTDISKGLSEDYPMPVIRVPSTSLTINKTMVGLPDAQWDAAADQITFTVKDGTATVATINLGATPPENANYTITKTDTGFQVVVTGLTVTKSYTVTETCNKLEGYNVTTTISETGSLVTMSRDATSNVLDVTNTYTPDNQLLTISKTVTGEMGSYTDDFTFTLTLVKTDSPTYTTPLTIEEGTTAKDASGNLYTGTLTTTDGTYTFVLSNDEQMVLSVPYGYDVTVTEQQDNNGYTVQSRQFITEIVDNEKPGLTPNEFSQTVPEISQDYTIEFANNRNPVAPTGLESNHTTPYVLMITAAGMAGLALIGGIVARRIRRRRQE